MVSNRKKKILVTGATGQQGGALARLLLEKNHEVYALTRNTNSSAAQDLKNQGANLIKGDLDNPDSLEQAVNSVDSIFLMGTTFEDGTEAQTRRENRIEVIDNDKGDQH